MRSRIVTTDANGKAEYAGSYGRGFCVLPAVDTEDAVTRLPGGYPLRVRVRGEGEPFEVASGGAMHLGRQFDVLDIEGATPNATYQVVVLERDGERYEPGRKSAALRRLAAPYALPGAAPAAAGDGFGIRPGMAALALYFTGAPLGGVELWTRSAGGVWTMAETIDTSIDPVVSREVLAPGGRIYLRNVTGVNETGEIDVTCEVG